MSAQLQVGSKVTKWRDREPCALLEIVAIKGKKAVDNKGGEWIASSGAMWGSARDVWNRGPHVTETEEGHAARIKFIRERSALVAAMNEIGATLYNRLNTDAELSAYFDAAVPLMAVHARLTEQRRAKLAEVKAAAEENKKEGGAS